MNTKIYSLITAGLILAASCTSPSQQEATVSLEAYIALKNALVDSDTEAVRDAAIAYEKTLQDENGEHKITELVHTMANSADLESQRELFKTLSEALIESIKRSGSARTVYVQYCPMAFDDTGASWLSFDQEIENPYFGDEMLHCGSVEQVIE